MQGNYLKKNTQNTTNQTTAKQTTWNNFKGM